MEKFDKDGVNELVVGLPSSLTTRFGEICWAHGGTDLGWWPASIYDPRLFDGNVRQQARKNLGKKHLVYFFECYDSPFAFISSSKVIEWSKGLAENYHLREVSRFRRNRLFSKFQLALEKAVLEQGKPVDLRSAQKINDLLPTALKDHLKSKNHAKENNVSDKKKNLQFMHPDVDTADFSILPSRHVAQVGRHENEEKKKKLSESEELYCKIFITSPSGTGNGEIAGINVGFTRLPSRLTCTFADIRRSIVNDLVPEILPQDFKWNFYIPCLGPISDIQESLLGSALPFLDAVSPNATVGKGSARDPVNVNIIDTSSIYPPPINQGLEWPGALW